MADHSGTNAEIEIARKRNAFAPRAITPFLQHQDEGFKRFFEDCHGGVSGLDVSELVTAGAGIEVVVVQGLDRVFHFIGDDFEVYVPI